jgi:hypothetical protein
MLFPDKTAAEATQRGKQAKATQYHDNVKCNQERIFDQSLDAVSSADFQ